MWKQPVNMYGILEFINGILITKSDGRLIWIHVHFQHVHSEWTRK